MLLKKLNRNSKIGLVAPSGGIDESKLETAIQNMAKLELVPYYTERILARHGYLAGEDKNRTADLEEMFANKDIDAIFAIRGGVGATRILSKIDYNIIEKNPKIFIGYSDITALQYAFFKKTNLISFHGAVAVSNFSEYTINSFNNLFFNNITTINYASPTFERGIENREFDLITLKHGIAEGKIVGGNLSLMTAVIGTKFDIDYTDKIVMIEEIDEYPYKIDRMLTQLMSATNLKKANAIVMGIFKNCSNVSKNLSDSESLPLQTIFGEIFEKMNVPIIYGFPFGHLREQTLFPFGATAKIDTYTNELTILQDLFCEKK